MDFAIIVLSLYIILKYFFFFKFCDTLNEISSLALGIDWGVWGAVDKLHVVEDIVNTLLPVDAMALPIKFWFWYTVFGYGCITLSVQVIKGVYIIKGEDLPELFDEQAVTVKLPLVLGCLALPISSATAALAAAAEVFGTLGPAVLYLLLLNMVPETKTFLLGFLDIN